MRIYLFDPLGVLTGPFEWSEFPQFPGLGQQLPGNAIQLEKLLAPPKAGHVWVLVEGSLQQVADHRGVVFSTETGAEDEHFELGPLPEGLTKEPRPSALHHWRAGAWVKDAVQVHLVKVYEVNRACEAAIIVGFWSSALGEPHNYSSQLEDQLNLNGVIFRGVDTLYPCRDERGRKEFRPHTFAQIRQVSDDFTVYKLELLQKALQLKQVLDLALESDDVAALEAVTWEPIQS
jgi:hypothetical protein